MPISVLESVTGDYNANLNSLFSDYFQDKNKVLGFSPKSVNVSGVKFLSGNLSPSDTYVNNLAGVSGDSTAKSAADTYSYHLLGFDTDVMQSIQGGFNTSELRLLFTQQRIFERLMRCGSRYVEYLMSNFGIAPTDETLQRVQYLGGFKQAVVTKFIAFLL